MDYPRNRSPMTLGNDRQASSNLRQVAGWTSNGAGT